MKRLLLVICDLVKTGGMDRANYALASYLARQGLEIHAVAHKIADDLASLPNVIFHRVSKPLGSYFLGEPLLDRAGQKWAAKLAAPDTRVMVNGGNCRWGDANWVHYVHAAHEPMARASLARQFKNRWSRRLFLKGERRALGRARLIFANSQRTRRDLIELLGIDPSLIRTLYYGIDPVRFHPPSDEERTRVRRELGWSQAGPVVAFIGALGDRRKGFDVLYEAWRGLSRRTGFDAKLAVIGQGAELAAWKGRAADDGLAGSIDFMGFRSDVPRILQACDALAAPTRYEAYGLGVQEALACGLPSIVSRSAGVAERYDSALDDLLLNDPPNAGALESLLANLLSRPDHYRSATAPLSRRLRAYTWDHMAADMAAYLEGAGLDAAGGNDPDSLDAQCEAVIGRR